jgi:hypothetical protein
MERNELVGDRDGEDNRDEDEEVDVDEKAKEDTEVDRLRPIRINSELKMK